MNFLEKMRNLMRRTKAAQSDPVKNLLDHVSKELSGFSAKLESEVESDASGSKGAPQGSIEMPITYLDGDILSTSWNDPYYVTETDIKGTNGYKELEMKVRELGLDLCLQVEDDERYTEDDDEKYTIVVRGWSI